VTDDRFDYRTTLQPAFDLLGHAAPLFGNARLRVRMARDSVPIGSLVDGDAAGAASRDVAHIVQSLLRRVTVIRIGAQRSRGQDEVSALDEIEIRRDRYPATEFARRARFALADGLDFRRVPGVDIIAIGVPLVRDVPGSSQHVFEPLGRMPGQRGVRRNLAPHVAGQPPQSHPQKFQLPLGASLLLRASASLRLAPRARGIAAPSPAQKSTQGGDIFIGPRG
jgi:hypothetical protein